MIESLVGDVTYRMSDRVVISVAGVGYGVSMAATEMADLNIGQKVEVSIYTMVREDALKLFGFLNVANRELFEVLLGISGVGPKVALAMLTVLPGAHLIQVVQNEDLQSLQGVPGIGRRTAEKIMLELRNRIERLQWIFAGDLEQTSAVVKDSELAIQPSVKRDLHSALENLGFKSRDIERVLKSLIHDRSAEDLSFSILMREALTELTPAQKGQRSLNLHA